MEFCKIVLLSYVQGSPASQGHYELNWPANVFCVLQQNLSFHYVRNWPIGFGGVEVMNLALATAFQPVQEVSANERPQKSTKSETSKPVFSCDFSTCNFSSFNARAQNAVP